MDGFSGHQLRQQMEQLVGGSMGNANNSFGGAQFAHHSFSEPLPQQQLGGGGMGGKLPPMLNNHHGSSGSSSPQQHRLPQQHLGMGPPPHQCAPYCVL